MGDCTLCGGRWINGYMGCSRPNCNEYRLVTECNEWPVQLGLSIRRFVRRAEVEALVADVRYETLRHDYHCNNRRSGCGCRGDKAQSALDRLAALALEGHGDG